MVTATKVELQCSWNFVLITNRRHSVEIQEYKTQCIKKCTDFYKTSVLTVHICHSGIKISDKTMFTTVWGSMTGLSVCTNIFLSCLQAIKSIRCYIHLMEIDNYHVVHYASFKYRGEFLYTESERCITGNAYF